MTNDHILDLLYQEQMLADDLADVLTRIVDGWENRLGHSRVIEVLARYREARK
jgi:hypothetical protein